MPPYIHMHCLLHRESGSTKQRFCDFVCTTVILEKVMIFPSKQLVSLVVQRLVWHLSQIMQ